MGFNLSAHLREAPQAWENPVFINTNPVDSNGVTTPLDCGIAAEQGGRFVDAQHLPLLLAPGPRVKRGSRKGASRSPRQVQPFSSPFLVGRVPNPSKIDKHLGGSQPYP